MLLARIIALTGTILMGTGILYAFTQGNFSGEGALLLTMPWGIVSLLDLYTGFALFSIWIAYREKSVIKAAVWIGLLMSLGFLAGSLYTLLALQTSGNDWKRFWMGDRATSS